MPVPTLSVANSLCRYQWLIAISLYFASDFVVGAWKPVIDESTDKFLLVSFPASKKEGNTAKDQPNVSQDHHRVVPVNHKICKVSE